MEAEDFRCKMQVFNLAGLQLEKQSKKAPSVQVRSGE